MHSIRGYVNTEGDVLSVHPTSWMDTKAHLGQQADEYFAFDWELGQDTTPRVLYSITSGRDPTQDEGARQQLASGSLCKRSGGATGLFNYLRPIWECHGNFWLSADDDPDALPTTIDGDLIVDMGNGLTMRYISKVTHLKGEPLLLGSGPLTMESLLHMGRPVSINSQNTLITPCLRQVTEISLHYQGRLVADSLSRVMGDVVLGHSYSLVAPIEIVEGGVILHDGGDLSCLQTIKKDFSVYAGRVYANHLEHTGGALMLAPRTRLDARWLRTVGRLTIGKGATLIAPLLKY